MPGNLPTLPADRVPSVRRVKARLNSVKTPIKVDQGYRIPGRRLLTLVQADHHREACTP